MKAVLYKKKSKEKMIFSDVEKPIPKKNEILVKVHGTSVNAADFHMMKMGFGNNSKIYGADIAGTVEALGEGVTGFQVGEAVLGDLSDHGFGGLAQFVAGPAKVFTRKPEGLSFQRGAALPLAGSTALQAVRSYSRSLNGKEVLMLGASGGVGLYAVQLAKHFGARVTGVCSARNEELLRSIGVDSVIDYRKQEISDLNQSFDFIIAINGSYSLRTCMKLLNSKGEYIAVGGSMKQILVPLFFGWAYSIGGKKVRSLSAKSSAEDIAFLADLAANGQIKPIIDRTFSLEETAKAYNYVKEQHASGKVVIEVKGNKD